MTRQNLGMVAVLVATGCAGTTQSSDPRVAQYLLDELRAMNEVPGLSAAVSVGDDVVWTGVSGWADYEARRKLDPGTPLRLASVSKLLTATLALRAIDAGLLDADGDIRECVPAWPQQPEVVITPRHLASHTSGIRHYSSEDGTVDGRHFDTLIDALTVFAGRTSAHAPGAGYTYSSWGYALLGACVESVTGQSFGRALDTHVLTPLGLDETFVEDVRALPQHAGRLYERQPGQEPSRISPNDQSYASGATGIRSTPRDLVRFASAFVNGKVVEDAIREMAWTPVLLTDGSRAGNSRYGVGFGWRTGRDWDDRAVVHHAGVTPGARSVLLAYPERNAAVALLSNARWTSRVETTAELLAAPFLEEDATEEDCPVGEWSYSGEFARGAETAEHEYSATGSVAIEISDGLCVGRIEPRGALRAWVVARNAPTERLAMALVARRNDVRVFAFVNPWGLSPLRLRMNAAGGWLADGDIAGKGLTLTGAPRREHPSK